MKKLKFVSTGIAMFIALLVMAAATPQDQIITGVVSDATGPIPSVNIVVKGTQKSTLTDIDGKYSIVASKGDVLEFSYVGMQTLEVTVADQKVINVTLQDYPPLEGIVVTGSMGIRRTRDAVTSNQQVVRSEVRQKQKHTKRKDKVTESAKATAYINASNRIVLRGNRATEGKSPLIVIDNRIATEKELAKIKPRNIKSTQVIKGPQGAALYGSDGVNGVIMVTTKNAKPQKQFDPVYEDYDSFVENPFENPLATALSTFSIDVDNASYTNIRRFINQGQRVPKDAVRVEEMVNFFKYQYPQPQDEHPFSINTEMSDCPWNKDHRLLRIGLQGRVLSTDNLPASNLVFLIDVSGSMWEQNKLPLLQQSLKILANELRPQDKVAIVVYAGAAGMVLPPTSGADKQTIINAIDLLQSGGSTAAGAGIELAYKIATDNFLKDGNNRVILATDGDFNVGAASESDLTKLIETKRKTGVFLTCLGYGMGNYKDSKLELLADKGNGNYAYIDNIQEARRFLSKEFKGSMFAIAKDVKIQVEFNPLEVSAYRLIGYENRKLRPEDFTDDAIDAGELGSGHTVTALYEIIPSGVGSKFLKQMPKLKYSKVKSTGNTGTDVATIKFRYKKPDGDKSRELEKVVGKNADKLSKASDDFKFSAAVAWFGLKLRDSNLITEKSSSEITKLAKEGLSKDDDGYKAEFIRLVESANSI